MKRLIAITALLPFLTGPLHSLAADESVEPALVYTVSVGEKIVTVTEGEAAQLDGTFNNPKITVTPQPYRVFSCQGITFKYPRSFVFEADIEDQNAKTWVLSGNDFILMCMVVNEALSTADFASNIIEQFGSEQAKVVDAEATITLVNTS